MCNSIIDANSLSKASLGPYAWESATSRKPCDRTRSINVDACPVPPAREEARVKPKVLGYCVSHGLPYLQHDDLKALPRSSEVFDKIHKDPILSCDLPKPNATAGKVLDHASKSFERLLKRFEPMSFKFGITHDPSMRWHNKKFGYKYSNDRFARMHILYAAANPYGPSFLEAALISGFGSILLAIVLNMYALHKSHCCLISLMIPCLAACRFRLQLTTKASVDAKIFGWVVTARAIWMVMVRTAHTLFIGLTKILRKSRGMIEL